MERSLSSSGPIRALLDSLIPFREEQAMSIGSATFSHEFALSLLVIRNLGLLITYKKLQKLQIIVSTYPRLKGISSQQYYVISYEILS